MQRFFFFNYYFIYLHTTLAFVVVHIYRKATLAFLIVWDSQMYCLFNKENFLSVSLSLSLSLSLYIYIYIYKCVLTHID